MLYLEKSNGSKGDIMENFKIYVVIDDKKFKELCKDKLQGNLTEDNLKIIESFEKAKVHIVPHNIPSSIMARYIVGYEQKYDVYKNVDEKWEKEDFIEIDEHDISFLIDSEAAIDYEEYKKWEDVIMYLITDREKFIEYLGDKLSDIEKIVILNKCIKAGEDKIYLIKKDNEYYLLSKFEKSNIAHIFTRTTLDIQDISSLRDEKLIEFIRGKIHREYNNIWFEDSKELALVTDRVPFRYPRISFSNDRYRAHTTINTESNNIRRIMGFGKTKEQAIHNLAVMMQRELAKNKENQSKNLEDSIEDDFADI